MKRTHLALGGALLLLMIALGLKGQLVTLAKVRGESSAGQFDTRRALARLSRILGDERPHPVDSAANDAVRERLLVEMRAVGLDPRVTDDFACNSDPRVRAVSCARVRNIVATIGPPRGRHVLAVAHYDSTAAGPGAADDGIGVAALLETAAQLRGVRLARPVTFLINEGEEAGLLGARAFNDRHPLAGRVAALVNLEARGVTGPAIMFETSRPNAPALASFRAERPVANSLTTDFYRLIPNATDVDVFAERDWTILNFAIIGNETRYHSAGDDLAALDPRSVQHLGDQALATILNLATRPSPDARGEMHYTDILGRRLVAVPAMLSLAVLAILALFFGWTAWRRRSGLGLAGAAIVAGLADAAILGWLGQFLVGLFRSGHWWRAHPELTALAIYLSALAACAAATMIVRTTPVGTLRAAFWLVFMVLAVLLTLIAPGAAILFILPPLIAGAGMGTRWERGFAITAAAVLFLLFAPLLELVETLLGHGSAWMFAPIAATIFWPWLIELKPLFAATRMRLVLGGIGAATLAGWAAAAAAPAYSEDRQQRFSIEYAWDADARRGMWAVVNEGAPLPGAYADVADWTGGTEVPWGTARRWTAPAPVVAMQPPSIEVLAQREVPGGRLVSFRIGGSGFDSVALRAPPEAQLRSLRAGGFVRPIGRGEEEDPYFIRCLGRACDGAVFEMLLASRAPVEWTLIGSRTGVPAAAQTLTAARPRHARPQYAPDSTIVLSRLRL